MTRPFIPFPGGARVVLTITHAGTPYVFINTFHAHKPAPFTLADLTTLAGLFVAWDTSAYADCRSGVFYLYEVRAEALDTETAPRYTTTLGTTHPGTWSGGVYSYALSKSVALRTGFRGRGNQGRLMLPPLPATTLASPGTILLSFAHTAEDAVNELIATLESASPSMPLVVASYRHDHNWRTVADWSPVTDATVHNTRVDSQRRRLNQVAI